MSLAAVLYPVADFVVRAADQVPADEEVKAGWTAFVILLLLGAAVVVLGFSLTKQLRRAQAAKDAGVYGDEPESSDDGADQPSEGDKHSAG